MSQSFRAKSKRFASFSFRKRQPKSYAMGGGRLAAHKLRRAGSYKSISKRGIVIPRGSKTALDLEKNKKSFEYWNSDPYADEKGDDGGGDVTTWSRPAPNGGGGDDDDDDAADMPGAANAGGSDEDEDDGDDGGGGRGVDDGNGTGRWSQGSAGTEVSGTSTGRWTTGNFSLTETFRKGLGSFRLSKKSAQ